MSGWIKLYRKLQDSPLYKQLNSKQRDVMINILLLASHESNEWEFGGTMYKVEPGQFVTSIDAIQKKCASDVSVQNIRTSLSKLEKHKFLTNQPTNKNRLITVVNWALYQVENQQATNKQINKQLTSKLTNKKTSESLIEQGVSAFDEDELTSKLNENQQALVAETNNYQEVRSKRTKEIKTLYAEFVSLTESEYQKLADQHGEDNANRMIEVLDNYKGSKGKKYASDYRAILNWVVEKVIGVQAPKQKDKAIASRDKEVEFQRWMEEGNDPDGFDWR